jgi:hypothetical protein
MIGLLISHNAQFSCHEENRQVSPNESLALRNLKPRTTDNGEHHSPIDLAASAVLLLRFKSELKVL